MSSLKVNDDSSVAINIKWLVQIIILVGTAVYLYLGLDNRVTANEDEIRSIRYNQNTYIFPDIRVLESEVIDFKMERERVRKDIQRLRELVNEIIIKKKLTTDYVKLRLSGAGRVISKTTIKNK
jgi:hypothetical protein